MKPAALGEQELTLLKIVAQQGPLSVAEAWERFSADQACARTTVLTMLERLRKKGYLTRRESGGVNRYVARHNPTDLMRGVVERFVDTTLAGSVSPFVAYLSEAHELTDDELAQLKQLVARLEVERGR